MQAFRTFPCFATVATVWISLALVSSVQTAALPDAAWYDDFLQTHNNYRATHQASALTYNQALNTHAQTWAETLAAADNVQHSDGMFGGTPVGENLAMKYSSQTTNFAGHVFVDMWYSEVEFYDFNTNSGSGTGHFTQVVWKGSRELGVGRAVTASGKVIVVANYLPTGNLGGAYGQNVLPATDDSNGPNGGAGSVTASKSGILIFTIFLYIFMGVNRT